VFCRPISIGISLIYTPLLLKYLGDERYGIWVTMLSILNWILVFDIGIGNGLRNVLTIKIKQEKNDEAQSVVSSAYYALGTIVFFLFLIGLCICFLVNWNSVFKSELNVLPAIIICLTFICINFVASLQKYEYFAIQKSEANSVFSIVVQLINLFGIIMLRYCASQQTGGNVSFNRSFHIWNQYFLFHSYMEKASLFYSISIKNKKDFYTGCMSYRNKVFCHSGIGAYSFRH
jgi:O-antigen/teichoic acid export membrane protein